MAVTATFRTTAGTKTWEVSPRKVLDIDGLSTGFELSRQQQRRRRIPAHKRARAQKEANQLFVQLPRRSRL